MQEVWNGTVVTDDALSRCISELRKVLGGSPRNPQYIETIRKSGYRLIAPVTLPSDEAEENGAALSPPRPAPESANGWTSARAAQPPRRSDAKMLLWGAGLLVAALAGILWLSAAFERDTEIPFRTVPFTSLPGEELQPAPSPDGEQIAFVWDGEEGENYDVYVKQVGTETLLRLTESPAAERSPAWSPDGQRVAFVRCADDECGISIVQALGGAEREVISPSPREIEGLVWSPDGGALAYAARNEPGGAFSLYLLPLETLEEAPPHLAAALLLRRPRPGLLARRRAPGLHAQRDRGRAGRLRRPRRGRRGAEAAHRRRGRGHRPRLERRRAEHLLRLEPERGLLAVAGPPRRRDARVRHHGRRGGQHAPAVGLACGRAARLRAARDRDEHLAAPAPEREPPPAPAAHLLHALGLHPAISRTGSASPSPRSAPATRRSGSARATAPTPSASPSSTAPSPARRGGPRTGRRSPSTPVARATPTSTRSARRATGPAA